ncbi:hypothetical protein Leryth_014396 [Lithospermum erythrorhizon]|nr:hypothetical protein Leryth_014396 [Lithospermum erythrorhizon]
MMSIIYIALLFMTLWFIFLWCRCKDSKRKIPTNWPIVGMTPGLLVNLHRIHDFLADLLIANTWGKEWSSDIPDKIWRDTLLNMIFAGKETVGVALTWFFWLIVENPIEETKIREEIMRNSNEHEVGWLSFSKVEELDKLTYLHGALCETLRLFSPAPIEADTLPSGHRLKPNTKTMLSFYSMGRMEQIWGKDCLEFKPSRWISDRGGSWFGNGGMLITCDPANIHHILSKKFPNYGKRPQFKKIFAELGDGIFIAEAQSWEFQRKTTHAILHHKGFVHFMVTSTWNKLGIDVDLQELIHLTCVLLFDYDPVSLSIEFPKFPCKEAFTVAEEGILYRHILPEIIWKLQKRFQIGKENKLRKAVGIIDEFLGNQIASKHEKLKNNVSFQEGCFDFLTGYMKSQIPDKILRDTMFNFIFAGKETIAVALTWFFWLMAKNPDEEYKIREEIVRNLDEHEAGVLSISTVTLSLFPPVPLNHKAPVEADILPSGHRLKPNTKTVLSFYSMGRMEQIWGKDCLEFKPSRWISERGGIKHEASFKFTAFNAGARSCLGKDMSFIQMKMVAAALIYHFEFKVLEGQSILPSPSIILHMQNDLDNNMYVM